MEYCCHIWATRAQIFFLSLESKSIFESLWLTTKFSALQSLSKRRNIANLLQLLTWKVIRLTTLVPPFLPFRTRPCHDTYIVAIHSHSLSILLGRNMFYSISFFPRNAVLWKRLPRRWFPNRYNINLFNSMIYPFLHGLYLLRCNALPYVAVGSFKSWMIL